MIEPLVSCIMPTVDRQPFIQNAIKQFFDQTYSNKQLIIVDTGRIPIQYESDRRITHIFLPNDKTPLGTIRNTCCKFSSGSIIVHWDDDDLNHPDRISIQVEALLNDCSDVCGIQDPIFFNDLGQEWKYKGPDNWVLGASLAYTREFWNKVEFEALRIGEDDIFVSQTRHISVIPNTIMRFRIHDQNTSIKKVDSLPYVRIK